MKDLKDGYEECEDCGALLHRKPGYTGYFCGACKDRYHFERCEACRSRFPTKFARVRWCQSCKTIIEGQVERLEELIEPALLSPEDVQREIWDAAQEALTCSLCGWSGNKQREEGENLSQLKVKLPVLAIAQHYHLMKHTFWHRFGPSRGFWPKPKTEREVSLTQWEAEQPDWKEVAFVTELEGGGKAIRAITGTVKDYFQRLAEEEPTKPLFFRLWRLSSQSSR